MEADKKNPNITFYKFDGEFKVNEAFEESKGEEFDYPSVKIKSVDKNGKLVISFSDNLIVPDDM